MLERQREGIAKAKREGRYKGRAPTARRQTVEIIRLKEAGVRRSERPSGWGLEGRACIGCWIIAEWRSGGGVRLQRRSSWNLRRRLKFGLTVSLKVERESISTAISNHSAATQFLR
jgi:hypothetical protein